MALEAKLDYGTERFHEFANNVDLGMPDKTPGQQQALLEVAMRIVNLYEAQMQADRVKYARIAKAQDRENLLEIGKNVLALGLTVAGFIAFTYFYR